jgi:hypothetical protein
MLLIIIQRGHMSAITLNNLRPCRFDLSVCITWSGLKKTFLENIENMEKLILTASTALMCLYGLYRFL